MNKKPLILMTWSEIPIWFVAVSIYPVISFILMWIAKVYINQLTAYFFFANWALGTFIYIFVLIFFPNQYPRKK